MKLKVSSIISFLTITGMLLLTSSSTLARECNSYERDKAEAFAEQAAKELVDKFGGGQDIRVEVTSCNYNTYSKKFKIGVNIYWNGAIFRSHHYELDGILTVNEDGTQAEFARTWANQRLKDLETLKKWVVGGIIVIGVLNALGKSEQNNY